MKDRDCTLPAAREGKRVSLAVRPADTQSARAAGTAQRLEDVEKVVRELRAELAELQQWLFDCQDAIVTRIESLEDSEGPSLMRSVIQLPHDYV